jgi:hypothetical protein
MNNFPNFILRVFCGLNNDTGMVICVELSPHFSLGTAQNILTKCDTNLSHLEEGLFSNPIHSLTVFQGEQGLAEERGCKQRHLKKFLASSKVP